MAALEQKLERALAEMKDAGNKRGPYMGDPGALGTSLGELGATALQNEMSSNWEFQKVLESEKPRLRGVLEALGPAGWYGFATRT